jgi:hypothetical protein
VLRTLPPGAATSVMQVQAGANDEAQQPIHQARYGRQLLLRTAQITPNPDHTKPRRTRGTVTATRLLEACLCHDRAVVRSRLPEGSSPPSTVSSANGSASNATRHAARE